MDCGRRWNNGSVRVVVGALVLCALFAGPAHAKPWAKWAPAPLDSDSDYVAMSARAADSLRTGEFAWFGVQRNWRAQRDAEASGASKASSITDAPGVGHRVRSSDKRFATLASRPYGSLRNEEFAWLVSENAAQRADLEHMSTGGTVAIVVIVAGAAALAGAIWGVHAAIEGIFSGH
jgi:hypothetical protein